MTYSIQEVVANLNTSLWPLLLTGALSFIGYFVYYGEAIRLGFRQKTFGVPVCANMYFFAHDMVFLFLFDRWFHQIDHWLFKAFWVGILLFTVLEMVVHYQTIRFGLKDVFPSVEGSKAVIAYGGLQLAIAVLFWFMFTIIEDPLFLIHFSITVALSAVLMHPMMRNRKSGNGQSKLLAISLIITPAIFYFGFLPLAAGFFQSVPYLLMGVATVATASVYLVILQKHQSSFRDQKHYLPAPDSGSA